MFVTDEWAAERTGKHRTTILRWRLSGTWPPELVRLARLELEGDLALIHADWEGWRLDARSGELCAPLSRLTFKPGRLLAIPLREQHVHALQRQLDSLRNETVVHRDQRSAGRRARLVVALGWSSRSAGRRARFVDGAGTVCPHCGASDRRRSSRTDDFDFGARRSGARWAR
jgi:hypothetical protein